MFTLWMFDTVIKRIRQVFYRRVFCRAAPLQASSLCHSLQVVYIARQWPCEQKFPAHGGLKVPAGTYSAAWGPGVQVCDARAA